MATVCTERSSYPGPEGGDHSSRSREDGGQPAFPKTRSASRIFRLVHYALNWGPGPRDGSVAPADCTAGSHSAFRTAWRAESAASPRNANWKADRREAAQWPLAAMNLNNCNNKDEKKDEKKEEKKDEKKDEKKKEEPP
ncbi:unnamed protein product [Boreogadus saida]